MTVNDDEINALKQKTNDYNEGETINHMNNILNENMKIVYQKQSQHPLIGQIVPIYNKYLQLTPNKKWKDENAGIEYYVLGDKVTLKQGDSPSLSQIYQLHFGETQMIMPQVKNKGIIGGHPIIKDIGQTGFDRVYRNTIGVKNDDNGNPQIMTPEDVNVESNDDNKKILKVPVHQHLMQENIVDGFGLSEHQMSSSDKKPLYVLDRVGVKSVDKKELITKKQTTLQQTFDITDPGTEDVVLCLVLNILD